MPRKPGKPKKPRKPGRHRKPVLKPTGECMACVPGFAIHHADAHVEGCTCPCNPPKRRS